MKKPAPNHYVLIKRACETRDGRRTSAAAAAQALLAAGIWPLWQRTANRTRIAAGDRVAVYTAGAGNQRVIATAEVAAVVAWTHAMQATYPLVLDGVPASVLTLTNIVLLSEPIDVKQRLSALTFIPSGSVKWGVAFMCGTRAVTPSDFDRLTTGTSNREAAPRSERSAIVEEGA